MRFRFRLILSFSLLIALTFGAGGAVLISSSFQSALQEEEQSALHSYETVRNTLYLVNASSLGSQSGYASLLDALEQLENRGASQYQALTLSSEDRIIYRSGDTTLEPADLPSPERSRCAYALYQAEDGYDLQVLGLIDAGSQTLELWASFRLSAAYNARASQLRLYLIIYAVVAVLGILLVSVLSYAFTGPLRRLTVASRRIARGDLSQRSNIRTTDEFGQLSRDFDAMADKLQQTIEQLESDMQRQESFMGAFAHELKTPMTSIIGYADLLRQGILDENQRLGAANYIFSEGQRLEALSRKLLQLLLTEQDTPEWKPVNLAHFLEEVRLSLQPVTSGKNIRLVCRGESVRVWLDPDLVKSLLYNLADNAAKAMDSGGIIGITGRAIPGGCEVQVIDNGRGMEEKELSRITEAFYRVDKSRSRQQGGAGLGLALCQRIVQLHGGHLSFSSAPGKGTRVTATLYGKGGARREKS